MFIHIRRRKRKGGITLVWTVAKSHSGGYREPILAFNSIRADADPEKWQSFMAQALQDLENAALLPPTRRKLKEELIKKMTPYLDHFDSLQSLPHAV